MFEKIRRFALPFVGAGSLAYLVGCGPNPDPILMSKSGLIYRQDFFDTAGEYPKREYSVWTTEYKDRTEIEIRGTDSFLRGVDYKDDKLGFIPRFCQGGDPNVLGWTNPDSLRNLANGSELKEDNK